jgi:hypothetical protein
VAKQIGTFRVLLLVAKCYIGKVITIDKPVSNTILLVIISALKTMLIRPCQCIHTALLIYPYGPGKIFIRPCHTDQLDYLIKVLRTSCFCVGPGIDSRSAVLALGANTAHLESIPGPIQKQPVSNIILLVIISALLAKNHVHMALSIYTYGPVNIYIRPC